jgi:hypothetical protein
MTTGIPARGRLTLTALQNLYPVRKTQHSLLSADRYAGDGGNKKHQILIPTCPALRRDRGRDRQGGGFKSPPVLTGFVFQVILLRIHDDHSGENTRS